MRCRTVRSDANPTAGPSSMRPSTRPSRPTTGSRGISTSIWRRPERRAGSPRCRFPGLRPAASLPGRSSTLYGTRAISAWATLRSRRRGSGTRARWVRRRLSTIPSLRPPTMWMPSGSGSRPARTPRPPGLPACPSRRCSRTARRRMTICSTSLTAPGTPGSARSRPVRRPWSRIPSPGSSTCPSTPPNTASAAPCLPSPWVSAGE